MSNLTAGIQLPPLSVDIITDTSNLTSGMNYATRECLESAEKLGGKLSDVGGKLTKSLTVPITGAAIAMGKFAMDTETDLATISGRLGTTAEDTQELKEVAQDLYNNGFGESLEDCVNDLVVLQQNIREISNMTKEQKEDLLEQISTIKSLFGAESEEITRTLNNMLRNGLINNVQDGLDIITRGFQEGLNSGGDLLDVLYEYSPQFKKLGLEGSESLAYIKAGLDAGAYNADKMADALKELSIRAIDGSDTTIQGFELMGKNADEMMRKFAAGGETAQEALKETLEGLKNIQDPLNQDLAGVDLFGTMWEDSSKQAILAMGDVTGGLDNVAGAAKRASEEVNDTSAVKFTTALRECKSELIPLGTELLNMATEILPSLVEMVKGVSNAFNSMDKGTQKTVIKLGLLTAALGPMLSVGGKAITIGSKLAKAITSVGTAAEVAGGISTATSATGMAGLASGLSGLVTAALPVGVAIAGVGGAVYAMHENTEYLNTSVATTTDELPFLQRAFNDLNGGVIKSREEMESLGLVYKEWTDNVSDDLQKSVDDTADKFANLNFEVQRLATNKIVISEDTKNDLISRTTEICNGIVQEIQSHTEEGQNALREVFGANGKEDWYENTILNSISESLNNSIDEIREKEEQITDIYQKAYEEHREIGESEKVAIEEIYAEIGDIKVRALSDNSNEYTEALAEFNVKCRSLNLKGISELLSDKKKELDNNISQDKEYYDTKIEMLSMNLNNMNTSERIAAEQAIRDLESERDKKVKTYEDTYKSYLDTIEENYPEMYKRINLWTGKINSVEEQRMQDSLTKFESNFNELDKITQSGYYKLYNSTNKTWDDMYVKVDETTGRIVGVWNNSLQEGYGCTEEVQKKTVDEFNKAQGNISTIINNLVASNSQYNKSTREMAMSVASSLKNITQNTDGTYNAVLKVNGTPINVKVEKDGAIRNLQDIINMMNNIPSTIHTTVLTTYQDENGNSFKASKYYSNNRGGYYYTGHYNGLDYVPYDGYTARLHKGERVLTAKENEEYSSSKTNNSTIQLNIANFNNNRKQDVKAFAEELEFYRQQLSRGGGAQ